MSGNPASLQGASSLAWFLARDHPVLPFQAEIPRRAGGVGVRAVGALQPAGLGDMRWGGMGSSLGPQNRASSLLAWSGEGPGEDAPAGAGTRHVFRTHSPSL